MPELIKVKNDIEYIEGIEFLIRDTYLNIADPAQSIMNVFDPQFSHPVQLIELMKRVKIDHDPGANALTPENLPEAPEIPPQPQRIDYFQGPPLIDEVIFDGHTELFPQEPVPDLFGAGAAGGLVADDIPQAPDIP